MVATLLIVRAAFAARCRVRATAAFFHPALTSFARRFSLAQRCHRFDVSISKPEAIMIGRFLSASRWGIFSRCHGHASPSCRILVSLLCFGALIFLRSKVSEIGKA